MNKIKAYVSHIIRGAKGVTATVDEMEANNQRAIDFTNELRKKFPTIEFYCPGEHDEFVLLAYLNDYLTEEQILDIDCDILAKRDLLINYVPDDYRSKGMQVENKEAGLCGIPVVDCKDTSDTELIERFLEGKLKG